MSLRVNIPSFFLEFISAHLIRFSMSRLNFLCCLGPPSTTTTFKLLYKSTMPVICNWLQFASSLNLIAGSLTSLTLYTQTFTP